MSELPSPVETDAEQYKRQTNAMTLALLRREKITLEIRIADIEKEMEVLTKNG